MPAISVVIPAFNRADWIIPTLRSVQNQTFGDFEVIVVDDGSTDNTAEIIAGFQADEPGIRLIRHDTNRGVSAARNSGIAAAGGDYIAFLDSDDLWRPQKLEKQFERMENLPRAQREDTFCFTHFIHQWKEYPQDFVVLMKDAYVPEGESLPVPIPYDDNRLTRLVGTRALWHGVGSTLFAHRRAIEKNGGFREGLGYGEDTEYVIRHIANGGMVTAVPRFLMIYRCPTDTTHYPGIEGYSNFMIDTYKYPIYRRWGFSAANQFAASLFIDNFMIARRKKQYARARAEILKAYIVAPGTTDHRLALLTEGKSRRHVPAMRIWEKEAMLPPRGRNMTARLLKDEP